MKKISESLLKQILRCHEEGTPLKDIMRADVTDDDFIARLAAELLDVRWRLEGLNK
jgi:hypothetical protein